MVPVPMYAKHQEKSRCKNNGFSILAEWTGLEPATPGVTGRYSNQLNYRSAAVTRRTKQTRKLASPRGFEPLYSP